MLLGTLGYYWRWAFCLGGYLGKGFDLGSFKEERMVFGLKKCFLRHLEEESIDHIHIHYVITRVLWHLLFSLFGVSWVLSSLVIEMILRWHGSFMSEKWKVAPHVAPICLFWTIWKKRNSRSFENEKYSSQELKHFFFYYLWVWFKLFIVFGPLSLADFVAPLFLWSYF